VPAAASPLSSFNESQKKLQMQSSSSLRSMGENADPGNWVYRSISLTAPSLPL
jgi:hypothetical protein